MIVNGTKKVMLAEHHKVCKSMWSKARGLMFTRNKVLEQSLVFPFDHDAKWSLHMFFVFRSIDILYLDEKKKVVELKKRFRPFTAYKPVHHSRYVLELPCGTLDNTGTDVGDKISW